MMCLSIVPKYFWTSPKDLGWSKTFWTWIKLQNSVVKSCFSGSNLKQFGLIQNHLGPMEGQSNSCVMYMYAVFRSKICSTLIKYDFNQCCVL